MTSAEQPPRRSSASTERDRNRSRSPTDGGSVSDITAEVSLTNLVKDDEGEEEPIMPALVWEDVRVKTQIDFGKHLKRKRHYEMWRATQNKDRKENDMDHINEWTSYFKDAIMMMHSIVEIKERGVAHEPEGHDLRFGPPYSSRN